MSSRAKSKQRRRRTPAPDQALRPEDVARPVRLVFEGLDRLREYMGNSNDLASAAALAQERLERAVDDLSRAAERYDSFDVLELVRLHNSPGNPETYRETEHEGLAAIIELVALVVATRGSTDGARSAMEVRPDASPVIDRVQAAAQQCIDAGTMLVLFRALESGADMARIRYSSVLREVMLRNLSYTHMLEDTLTGLFSDPEIEEDCRAAMGVTVANIRAVLDAAQRMHEMAWQNRFEALDEIAEIAEDNPIDPSDAVIARAANAWRRMWSNPADASTVDPATLAPEAGVDVGAVNAILDLFSINLEGKNTLDVVGDFFRGDSLLRTRPILRNASGERVIVHPSLLLPSIRERVEEELKRAGLADRYVKKRGSYLEETALDLLTPHLPGAAVHRSFEYFVPDPSANVAQTDPAQYTKLAETDGLFVLDDIAIVVEAKAGALSPRSRMGQAARLRGDLGKIVTAAAKQADRLRQRIAQDRGLRLRDDSWLDLNHVREIHTITVSLEDLSGLVTVTHELVTAGLLTGPHLPWTVSLHDLRVICEVVARPAELLLYLRRRTEPEVTRKFRAVDELDLFMHMLRAGLWVEPDPADVERELPQLGAQPVAARRRHARQQAVMLTSQTDQLDAWYLHTLGFRRNPAARPTLNANQELVALVDALAARKEPGWLSMGTTLLEGSGKLQRQWASLGSELVNRSSFDGRPHSYTAVGGQRARDSYLLVWYSQAPNQPLSDAQHKMREYVSAKKHQMQVARAAGFLFNTSGLVHAYFDNRFPGADSTLDAIVSRLALRPPEQMNRRPLRPKTPRRRKR